MPQSTSIPVRLPPDLSHSDAKSIALTRGYIAFVDVEDYEWIMQWSWRSLKAWKETCYAVRSVRHDDTYKAVLMHRLIMERLTGETLRFDQKVDHINCNTLDNRRVNLRIATNSENGRNRGKQVDNTSGYKGVLRDHRDGSWVARIKLHGQSLSLGGYDTPAEAAHAYDEAAIWYHGEFAQLNFPDADYGPPEEPKPKLLNRRNSSGYKGVVAYKGGKFGKWCAQITVKLKLIRLGIFDDIVEAAKAYDRAALEYFGNDWPINFPINLSDHERTL